MRSLPIFLLLGSLSLQADTPLGKPLSLESGMSVGALMSSPSDYLGKTVQVKGKVTEVCERMGCWMNLVDANTGKRIRIKVVDGEIVFPRSSVGKLALAEGKLTKLELTREQAVAFARHEAEEQGRKFNPASIKSGTAFYQIEGSGALILE